MAIGAIFEGAGFTQEQYDRINRQVTPGNQPPPGLLYHAAGPSETGFFIVEVWESHEARRRFLERTFGDAAGGMFEATIFEVTNIMRP